jgi:hypothetical protein
MPRKRDGPAPFSATPGPGQKGDERARLLPRTESSRKSGAHPSSSHSRVRRRQPSGWREFNVRVFTKPDATGLHAMHAYLRAMARKFGLEIIIDETTELHDPE